MTLERKEVAIKYFQGRCFICEKKFGKYFQFHHLHYYKDEKVFSDFRQQKDYWKYVSEKIIEEPRRFMLLCRVCHSRIDKRRGGIKRMKTDKVIRLFVAVLLSQNVNPKDIVPLFQMYANKYRR